MTDNGEQERLVINPNKGSLDELQRMETLVGLPADKWSNAPRASVIIAALVVYNGWTEEDARALPVEEATRMVRVETKHDNP